MKKRNLQTSLFSFQFLFNKFFLWLTDIICLHERHIFLFSCCLFFPLNYISESIIFSHFTFFLYISSIFFLWIYHISSLFPFIITFLFPIYNFSPKFCILSFIYFFVSIILPLNLSILIPFLLPPSLSHLSFYLQFSLDLSPSISYSILSSSLFTLSLFFHLQFFHLFLLRYFSLTNICFIILPRKFIISYFLSPFYSILTLTLFSLIYIF